MKTTSVNIEIVQGQNLRKFHGMAAVAKIMSRLGPPLAACAGAAILMAGFTSTADEPEWRFVVVGDSPGNPPNPTGVSPDLALIAQAIANERPAPDFVLFPGDLISDENFSGANVQPLAQQYTNWLAALAPIYNAGIPVYPVRGNHETMTELFGLPANDGQPFVDAFAPFSYIPDNGPTHASRLTYSFQHKNCLVLALDLYTASIPSPDLDIFPLVDQSWVDQQLATNHLPHVFAFGHTPIVQVSIDSVIATDNTMPMADAFFDSLVNAGCEAYFCGHDHFFNHTFLERNGKRLNQILTGGGGAPPELWNPGSYSASWTNCDITAQLAFHDQGKLGYCVVTVSNDQSLSSVLKFLDPSNNAVVTSNDFYDFHHFRCAAAGMISPLIVPGASTSAVAVATSIFKTTVQGTYTDPVSGVQKKLRNESSKTNAMPSAVVYRWLNKIVLYDKKQWDHSKTAEQNLKTHPIVPLLCDLIVSVHDVPRTSETIAYVAPVITETMDVISNQLVDLPLSPGQTITLNGFYFGARPPRAWLEYSKNGRIARLMLKPDRNLDFPDVQGRPGKSCMDLSTGQSTLRLTVPKAWPAGWNEQENHNLVIDNGCGIATMNFSEQPTSTPPE